MDDRSTDCENTVHTTSQPSLSYSLQIEFLIFCFTAAVEEVLFSQIQGKYSSVFRSRREERMSPSTRIDSEHSTRDRDPLASPLPSSSDDHGSALDTDASQVYSLWLDGAEEHLRAPNGSNMSESFESNLAIIQQASGASFMGSVANLCSATLGAGVLALPYAFYQAGIVLGLSLLLTSAVATAVSIKLLVQASEHYQLFTYELLVEALFGKHWRVCVEVSIVVFCGGCAVAYVIAVGDILERSNLLWYNSRALSMTAVWMTAMLPLSLLRRMQSLQFASGVGIASIGTLVFAAFIHLLEGEGASTNATNYTLAEFTLHRASNTMSMHNDFGDFLWPAHGSVSVLTACPIVLFAFSCQVNVCAIYQELAIPHIPDTNRHTLRQDRMRLVTLTAVAICATLYCSISIVALADFGKDVTPNILSSYEMHGIMQAAAAFMGVAVTFAFPLNVFPARVTLQDIFFPKVLLHPPVRNETLTAALLLDQDEVTEPRLPMSAARDVLVDESDERTPLQPQINFANGEGGLRNEDGAQVDAIETPLDEGIASRPAGIESEWNMRQHVGLTIGIAGSALCLALVVPDISVVFGVLGGTATSMLGFCVPGALGVRLGRDLDDWSLSVPSWVLLIGGAMFGTVTTVVTLWDTLEAL
jgi:amino acid permease